MQKHQQKQAFKYPNLEKRVLHGVPLTKKHRVGHENPQRADGFAF
jgi:hypothetical protein